MSHIDIARTTMLFISITIGVATIVGWVLALRHYTKDKADEKFSDKNHEKSCGRSFDDIKESLQLIHEEAREQRGSIDKLTNSVTELMTIERFRK